MVDTDYSGWSEDVALADGSVEQLWRGDRMSALSAAHLKGSLFVSGATSNQGSSNAVVLLSLPVDVHLSGIASRVTNPFGREPAKRARILHDLETVEPLLRRTASTEIDTNRAAGRRRGRSRGAARRPAGSGSASVDFANLDVSPGRGPTTIHTATSS